MCMCRSVKTNCPKKPTPILILNGCHFFRTTRGIADLSTKEIKEGAVILREKLAQYKPKIAVFNGKAIYQVYSGQKKFMFGKQPEPMEGTKDTWVWVMPSFSAHCAQLPQAIDKILFYEALRKFRDFLMGRGDEPHELSLIHI